MRAHRGSTCVLFCNATYTGGGKQTENAHGHSGNVAAASLQRMKQLPANTACMVCFLRIVIRQLTFLGACSLQRERHPSRRGELPPSFFLFFFLTKYPWPDSRSSHSRSETGSCRGYDALCRMNSASHPLVHKAASAEKSSGHHPELPEMMPFLYLHFAR